MQTPRKNFHFIFFMLFVANYCFAQTHSIDSLRSVLKNLPDDTNKVNALNLLSDKLWKMDKYDTLLICATTAEKLAGKLNFKSGLAITFMNEAVVYDEHGDYPKALEYELKALATNRELGNKYGIASNYNDIGNSYFAQNNYDKALEYYSKALAANQELGNKTGVSTDLSNLGNTYASQGNYSKALNYYLKALSISTEIGDNDGVARDLGNMGIIYYSQGNYSKALDCYSKALSMDRKSGSKSQAADDMSNIGNIYVDQNNPAKALEYYYKALAIYEETGDKASIDHCLGNIGVLYANTGNADSALLYTNKALDISKEIGDKDGVGVNLYGIGNIYRDKGNYLKALEYYFQALPVMREVVDKRFIISSYDNMGHSYIKLQKYKAAKAYLDSALALSLNINEKDEIEFIYRNMSVLDSATGDYKKSLSDYEKYTAYKDSMVNQESIKKITRMEVSFEYEKKDDSISAAQEKGNIIRAAEISRKNIITYGSIIIEILTAILAILFINRQQIKRKKDRLLFEKEKQHMEDELANAKILLDEYLKSMVEKNELLEKFKTDVDHLTQLKAKEIDENRIENIENLNKVTILTEDDWNKFKKLFEQVHKGFFTRLKEKFPDLTQAEIRLVCLSKLKTDTKQLAGILGVSTDAIKKARYRLRKKLGLSGDDNIDEIDISI